MTFDILKLRNFKCHACLDLPLSRLTVLTGYNSAGKSSIHQALALLAQSVSRNELLLKGSLVDLGCMGDVLNLSSGEDGFEIGIDTSRGNVSWMVKGDRRSATLKWQQQNEIPSEAVTEILNSLLSLVYLTTVRPVAGMPWTMAREDIELRIGPAGEGVVSLLDAMDQFPVTPALCVPDVPPTLPRQVEAWMGRFFPGFAMDIQPSPGQGSLLTLGLRTSDKGEFHSPANVGFGLLYLLPIVTALLHTKPGCLLVIETPEAHIHPSAQSLMGRFIAQVAATGVQIIVETHSDHLINGIRRAVKAKTIPNDKVVIHFFNGQREDAARTTTVMMDPTGNLADWPAGFFDQYDEDLADLTGWGTPVP